MALWAPWAVYWRNRLEQEGRGAISHIQHIFIRQPFCAKKSAQYCWHSSRADLYFSHLSKHAGLNMETVFQRPLSWYSSDISVPLTVVRWLVWAEGHGVQIRYPFKSQRVVTPHYALPFSPETLRLTQGNTECWAFSKVGASSVVQY